MRATETGTGRLLVAVAVLCGAAWLGGCGGSDPQGQVFDSKVDAAEAGYVQTYPDVVSVQIASEPAGTYALTVTISSPYDSPERYADGWRVLDEHRQELATHTLLHDHAEEQPFTRTQTGVLIPESVAIVTVEARDLEFGYGGQPLSIEVPRSTG